jgi:hypothetical protein
VYQNVEFLGHILVTVFFHPQRLTATERYGIGETAQVPAPEGRSKQPPRTHDVRILWAVSPIPPYLFSPYNWSLYGAESEGKRH